MIFFSETMAPPPLVVGREKRKEKKKINTVIMTNKKMLHEPLKWEEMSLCVKRNKAMKELRVFFSAVW